MTMPLRVGWIRHAPGRADHETVLRWTQNQPSSRTEALAMLAGCGLLTLALGCGGAAAPSPKPAAPAPGAQGTGAQAGQSSTPAGTGTPARANSGAPTAEHSGPWALDGSDEGPAAGLPLIITLEVPEVPEKICGPTPMPEG